MTLKRQTRTPDRRPPAADDLCRCRAGGAIMAWRVFDFQRAARSDANRPVCRQETPTAAHRPLVTAQSARPPLMATAPSDSSPGVPARPGTGRIGRGMMSMPIADAASRSFRREQSMTVSDVGS